MKLSFNPTIVKTWFTHGRSESEILVEAIHDGVLITFSDNNNSNATLRLSSKNELNSLKSSLANLKNKHWKDLRGFFDNDVVLSIDYDNYGDPYEECIKFTFCIPNSNTPRSEREVSASLNLSDEDSFINAISNHLHK